MFNLRVKKKIRYAWLTYNAELSNTTHAGIDALNAVLKPYIISGKILGEKAGGGATYWSNNHGAFLTFVEYADMLYDDINEVFNTPGNVETLTKEDILNNAMIAGPLFDFRWNTGSFSPAAWRRFVVNDYDGFIERTTQRCERR